MSQAVSQVNAVRPSLESGASLEPARPIDTSLVADRRTSTAKFSLIIRYFYEYACRYGVFTAPIRLALPLVKSCRMASGPLPFLIHRVLLLQTQTDHRHHG